MYEAPVTYDGFTYSCSETAYQTARVKYEADKNVLKTMPGKLAKITVKKMTETDNWHDINLDIMLNIVRAKFNQNPDIANKLIATGDIELVEHNYWNDKFWGVCKGIGENHLGKILMQVRNELRQ